MTSIHFDLEEDGRVKGIYKDGILTEKTVLVESPQAVVQTYYKAAYRNWIKMTVLADDREMNRMYGLQAFLMSLLGIEAFLNVFFHKVGREKNLPKVIAATTADKNLVTDKFKNLTKACYGQFPAGYKRINRELARLYKLRSAIVHPKWEPVTLGLNGFVLPGMSDNFQQEFEDKAFVQESLRWCLLPVARIGLIVSPESNSTFTSLWTTLADENNGLSHALQIAPDGD